MLAFEQTVDSEYLQARYLVLELAALLDRIDRAAGRSGCDPAGDVRVRHLREAVGMLAAPSEKPDRTERVLRHYSDADR